MFKALKQFAILIIFLLLIIFSALYFQEDREDESSPIDNETSAWLINAVKKTGQTLAAVANISSVVGPKLNSFEKNDQFSDWQEVANYNFNNSEALAEGRGLMVNLDQKIEQSEFRQFSRDFLKNIPSIYLDAKIYSNAWRNIRSLNWLRKQ